MKILVILSGALGDMIVKTPVLRALREFYPHAAITVIGNELFSQIAPEGTLVDKIIFVSAAQSKNIFSAMRLGMRLARERFDLAINLRYTSDGSALLTRLSRATVRAGAGPKPMMWCYTKKLSYPQSHYNEIYRYRDMITALGVPVHSLQPFVYCSAEQTTFAENFLKNYFLSQSNRSANHRQSAIDNSQFFVCLHPGASRAYRAWQPERFAEIGRRIAKEFSATLVITWADHERETAERVAHAIGDAALLAPRTPSIGHLAALYKCCALVICNNSGAMHVAVAADVPVIALTGSSELEDWAPLGGQHRSIKSPLGGLPDAPVSERKVMDALDVERVWRGVRRRVMELRAQKI